MPFYYTSEFADRSWDAESPDGFTRAWLAGQVDLD